MTPRVKYTILIGMIVILLAPALSYAGRENIPFLRDLDPVNSPRLKRLRKDIRKTIYIVKSGRPADEIPHLMFYRYRVKKKENFWTVLSRTSLDMDTLISVNSLTTPRDAKPGKILYIPNMRGVVLPHSTGSDIEKILKRSRVGRIYLHWVNGSRELEGQSIFIPCGKLSNLERSLFLGTGFMYPLKGGKRTSGFGKRRNPFNKNRIQFHNGVDLACRINSPVFAAREGNVLFTGYRQGYGKLVVIGHEHGYKSYYGHLNRIKIKRGARIKRGELIALSGNTGLTTGPHLHFEIRKSGRPINPGILVRGGR